MSSIKKKNSTELMIGGRNKRSFLTVSRTVFEVILWSVGMAVAGIVGGTVLTSIESDKAFSDLQRR